jgi:uncharacterized repeat protein (TIGR03803 family)
VLHSFTYGSEPLGKLIFDSRGAVYGTTYNGGLYPAQCEVGEEAGCGIAYVLTPPPAGKTTWGSGTLRAFGATPDDGIFPSGKLLGGAGGVVYGTTEAGGGRGASICVSSCGTVYELIPPAVSGNAWSERILYSFSGGSDGDTPNDALIADADGALYGTTTNDSSNQLGTVFKLAPPGHGQTKWVESVLHAFSGKKGDGAGVSDGLIADSAGDLYGVTEEGGVGYGIVFELVPPGTGHSSWTELVLHSFSGGTDGKTPDGRLVADAHGNLYGETIGGGIRGSCGGNGCGVIFELLAPSSSHGTWTERVLHSFSGTVDDVGSPSFGLTADASGALYGVSTYGGEYGYGNVFKLTPPAAGKTLWTESSLHAFSGAKDDGAEPFGPVILDAQGAIYGTTIGGGSIDNGVVYKLLQP